MNQLDLNASPNRNEDSDGMSKVSLRKTLCTESQKLALKKLRLMENVHLNGQTVAGFLPRCYPLIVGPSGSGKTETVKSFCRSEQIPLLSISSANWIVWGARCDNYTLKGIQAFVKQHSYGSIFIDEIDKIIPSDSRHRTEWGTAVFTELLALLDCDSRLRIMEWTVDEIRKLSSCFFIIGSGAWQHLYTGRKRTAVGFARGDHIEEDYSKNIWSNNAIPQEILFRFNCDLICLSHPSRDEYRQILKVLYRELGLRFPLPNKIEQILDQAIASQIGMRWIEHHLCELQMRKLSEIPMNIPLERNTY